MLGFALAGLARKKADEVASLENHFAMFLNPTYRWQRQIIEAGLVVIPAPHCFIDNNA